MIHFDMDSVSGTIDALYAAGYDDELWPDALESVRRLFNASGACVGKAGVDIGVGDLWAAQSDPAFQAAYLQHYAQHNLLWQCAQTLQPGAIYGGDVPLVEGKLYDSIFWNEWMAPQDYHQTLGYTVLTADGSRWLFDVERGARQAEFNKTDIALMRIIGRTMQKAVSLRLVLAAERVKQFHAVSALDALSVGAIILDNRGRIQHLNQMARTLLSNEAIFVQTGGELHVQPPEYRKPWNRLLSGACAPELKSSGFLRLQTDLGEQMVLSAHIAPYIPATEDLGGNARQLALVLLKPLGGRSGLVEQLGTLFALTPAEARVASALVDGLLPKQIAKALGVRITTIRTHLSNILAKAGVRQQSELFLLLAQMDLPVRPVSVTPSP